MKPKAAAWVVASVVLGVGNAVTWKRLLNAYTASARDEQAADLERGAMAAAAAARDHVPEECVEERPVGGERVAQPGCAVEQRASVVAFTHCHGQR